MSFRGLLVLDHHQRQERALRHDLAVLPRPSTEEFWDSLDHARLWAATSSPGGDFPRKWKQEVHVVSVDWVRDPPAPGSRVRVVGRAGRAADVSSIELAPLGRVQLPFNPSGAYLDAVVENDSFDDDPSIRIEYFGR